MCLTCNTGYFPVSDLCLPCNTSLLACQACNSFGTICTQCSLTGNWILSNGSCVCQGGFYLNSTTNTCMVCSLLDLNCLTCGYNTSYTCFTCDWGYYPINDTCLPCNTSLSGCLNCTMDANTCFNCDQPSDYFLDTIAGIVALNCTLCSLFQCLDCSSLDTCDICN